MLTDAWQVCFDDMGGSRPPPCTFEELQARYSEPHRAYHTLQHLEECLAWFAQARELTRDPGAVAFALFYHDAIYDTHAADNEARSAALAVQVLDEYVRPNDSSAETVTALILATKHDAVPQDADAQVLVDIDLAILGAPPVRFDDYERQVRQEYAWVDAAAFRAGRSRTLRHFLDQTRLYNTAFFRERLQAQARENLARSLEALGA
jgi:predicted metal-dependent HD superfamily phosphohydrolase